MRQGEIPWEEYELCIYVFFVLMGMFKYSLVANNTAKKG